MPLFAAIGLIAAASVLSLSRGTMVGLAAGLAWMVLVDRRHVRLVLVGGVLALAVALLVIRSDPSRFETALLYKQKVADYNVTTRYDAWNAAAELAVENPLLGVGPGNFRFYYNEQTGRPVGTHNLYVAHNAYLDVAAELGLLAMILFLLYLGMMMSRLTVAARRGYGLPGYALALRVSLLIAIVSRDLRLGAVLRSVLAARRPGHGRLGRRRTHAAAGLTCASSTSPASTHGGPLSHVRDLAPAMAAAGVDVHVVVANETLAAEFRDLGVEASVAADAPQAGRTRRGPGLAGARRRRRRPHARPAGRAARAATGAAARRRVGAHAARRAGGAVRPGRPRRTIPFRPASRAPGSPGSCTGSSGSRRC